MAKRKRGGASYKAQYTTYEAENRAKKNKVRKLLKRVRENENDKGAIDALNLINSGKWNHNRNKFSNKGWYHPQQAELLKKLKSENEQVVLSSKEKLKQLAYIYNDKKASAIKSPNKIDIPDSMLDQLYKVGLVNEKRYNSIKSRLGSLR